MSKKALIVLAEGFEEIEAVTVIDVLRRAECEVIVAGLEARDIRGAHNVLIRADTILDEVKGLPAAVILPGGMPGSENLGSSEELAAFLREMNKAKKIIGAICAAPGCVLAKRGLLEGKKATCYPGFERTFGPKTIFSEERVVKDGTIITSRGPGSALEFAYVLAGELAGEEKAKSVKKGMLTSP